MVWLKRRCSHGIWQQRRSGHKGVPSGRTGHMWQTVVSDSIYQNSGHYPAALRDRIAQSMIPDGSCDVNHVGRLDDIRQTVRKYPLQPEDREWHTQSEGPPGQKRHSGALGRDRRTETQCKTDSPVRSALDLSKDRSERCIPDDRTCPEVSVSTSSPCKHSRLNAGCTSRRYCLRTTTDRRISPLKSCIWRLPLLADCACFPVKSAWRSRSILSVRKMGTDEIGLIENI